MTEVTGPARALSSMIDRMDPAARARFDALWQLDRRMRVQRAAGEAAVAVQPEEGSWSSGLFRLGGHMWVLFAAGARDGRVARPACVHATPLTAASFSTRVGLMAAGRRAR